MIIENGTIEFKTQTAGERDPETGYRTAATDIKYGDPIPCQYNPVTQSLLARTAQGEAFKKVSFEIFIDSDTPVTSEQLRLTDQNGNVVGEFSVIELKPLQAVTETRILV